MFTDGRSKKVVFIAHCLLNQNSISDGTAVHPAAFKDIISLFMENDIGIIQLPCPELCCLGLDRGNIYGADSPVTVENTRIRREMEKAETQNKLRFLVDYTMLQIDEYTKHGFEIKGIVGANRSPNCGVESTSDNDVEISGMGVFMEALYKEITARGLNIKMTGIKSSDDITVKLRDFI